jgi:NhaA family Na+:H+ antiporter
MHRPAAEPRKTKHRRTALREWLASESSGGVVLMVAAVLALLAANSPLAPVYFRALQAQVLGLSALHWINDALMALFFLLVGLEIKREMLDGRLSPWPRRALPGIAAAGGMLVPALIYVAVNWPTPETLRGWGALAPRYGERGGTGSQGRDSSFSCQGGNAAQFLL